MLPLWRHWFRWPPTTRMNLMTRTDLAAVVSYIATHYSTSGGSELNLTFYLANGHAVRGMVGDYLRKDTGSNLIEIIVYDPEYSGTLYVLTDNIEAVSYNEDAIA